MVAERDALRFSAMGVSATSRNFRRACRRTSSEETRLRDRSHPIIVPRTSSVRAVVGDDEG